MKVSRWILAGLLVLMACSRITIHGVTPIFPRAGENQTVETLQPTFRWEPVAEPDVRYDFVIFETYRWNLGTVLGRKIYYQEGLQEPEHTLEVSLQPDQEYYWSVRVRRGEDVSEWSRFDFWEFVFSCGKGGVRDVKYPFFSFRTPDK